MKNLMKTMMITTALTAFTVAGASAGWSHNSKKMDHKAHSQTSASVITPSFVKAKDLTPAEIMELQRSLNDKGYNLTVNGNYNSETKTAIQRFQANNNIDKNTKMLNEDTLNELGFIIRDYPNANVNANANYKAKMNTGQLSRADVMSIQEHLRDEGQRITVDGVFGPNTRAAIREFQRENGIRATGQLDAQTLSELDVNIRTSQ